MLLRLSIGEAMPRKMIVKNHSLRKLQLRSHILHSMPLSLLFLFRKSAFVIDYHLSTPTISILVSKIDRLTVVVRPHLPKCRAPLFEKTSTTTGIEFVFTFDLEPTVLTMPPLLCSLFAIRWRDLDDHPFLIHIESTRRDR